MKCDTLTGIPKHSDCFKVWVFRMDWTEVEIRDIIARFMVYYSMLMKTEFSWVAILCQVVDSCHLFKGAWYFHLQSHAAQEERHVPLKCLYLSFSMVEAS
jgi:hypothetical protein